MSGIIKKIWNILSRSISSGCRKIVSDVNPDGFVRISEAMPDAILDVRYYSTYNFVGARIRGYEKPTLLLTIEAANALKSVSDEVKTMGYQLKIYDAYRPQRAVQHFIEWAKNDDERMKKYFYPDVDKSELFARGYIVEKSGHSRGSTIDLTLVDIASGMDVDMGGTFDWFGRESHPDWCGNPEIGQYTGKFPDDTPALDNEINEVQFKNRMLLRSVMIRNGFKPLAEEWWHFTLAEEPYPDTYFNFPVK